jgi:hypothetical protein
MATENKAVTSYLPCDVHLALIKYCTSKGLARKDKDGNDKPSLGTAIVEILQDYFQVTSLEQSNLNQKLEECFGSRIHDLVHDSVLRCLESQAVGVVQDKKHDSVHDFIDSSPPVGSHPVLMSDIGTISIENEAISPSAETSSIALEKIEIDVKLLAIRLGKAESTVNGWKTKYKRNISAFSEILQGKDPDGIKWIPLKGHNAYIPHKDTPEELLANLCDWIEKNQD